MTVTGFLVLLVAVFVAVWLLLAVDGWVARRRAERDWTLSDRTLRRIQKQREDER